MTVSPPPKPGNRTVTPLDAAARRAAEGASVADRPRVSGSPPPAPAVKPAELRLVIGREGLGIELAEAAHVECIDVTELSVSVAGVKFPLDVSGGVSRFRHRRGRLAQMELELRASALAEWAAPRLRGVLGPKTPDVFVMPRKRGATLAVSEREDVLDVTTRTRVVAFEVAVDMVGEAVRLTVYDARGSDLHAPATAIAIAALDAALGALAKREGAVFTIAQAATRIARQVLPDAGVRAPATDGMVWTALAADRDTWIMHASNGGAQAAPPEEAIRARELAALVRQGDDARLRGDLDAARALDLVALERAPRSRDIARRIAEIDLAAGARAEAALAILSEARGASTAHDGVLLGELYAEAGDTGAALAAFTRAGEGEEAPALAARAYERAAGLVADDHDALEQLDLAVARAPRLSRLRWARIARRLAAGRLEDALADVEHLEAQAAGPRAKHLVWRRAGAAWRKAGARTDAATLFERALRFVPDEPESLAGLGAALVAEGRAARGVALLTRAIELAEEARADVAPMVIELARALAERLRDYPAAIARVRGVAPSSHAALEARFLEGRWRAELGDLAGASLAFARLRELSSARVDGDRDGEGAAAWLVEAATFERDVRRDLLAAQRHLGAALRLRPKDAAALAAYRSVGAEIARPNEEAPPPPPVPEPRAAAIVPLPAEDIADTGADDEAARDEDQGDGDAELLARLEQTHATDRRHAGASLFEDEAMSDDDAAAASRVDELTRRIQLDPTDDAVADELADLLARLGRGHELLALLSARLEDATPERREALRAPTRAALERLERDAIAAGRAGEAQLFRDAVAMWNLG